MKKVNVTLRGINRSLDDGVSNDGLMAELINMRIKDGSLRPVGRPRLLKQFSRKPVYIHKNAGYEHYITVSGNSVYYDYAKNGDNFTAAGYIVGSYDGDLVSIESVGNILVVISTEDIYYYIWKGEAYSYIGNKPSLPVMRLRRVLGSHDAGLSVNSWREKTQFCSGTYSPGDIGSSSVDDKRGQLMTDVAGTINKIKYNAKESGLYCECVFVRYALRLFDGTLIMHSPVLTNRGDGMTLITSSQSDGNFKLIVEYASGGLYMEVADDKGISAWSDLVTSVDIYMAELDIHKSECPVINWYELADNPVGKEYTIETVDNLSSLFDTVDGFYYVGSMNIGEIKNGTQFDMSGISKGIRHNLVQQEVMEQDNLSQHVIVGNSSYVYNGRLILGDIKTVLKNPFGLDYYAYDTSSPNSGVGGNMLYLSTENGKSSVLNTQSAISCDLLYPVIVSTDYRATEIELFVGSKKKRLKLKKHPSLSLSYYQDPDLSDIAWDDGTGDIAQRNLESRSPNKIKVSGLNNPLAFPSKLTYTVSTGDVLAIQSVTSALSTGQFGQFPLYLFCADGVYALEVGDGDVVYSRATPVSRDCCANPKGIVSTDKSIVFATDDSIVLMTGSSSQRISADMDGYLPSFLDSSPVIGKAAAVAGYAGMFSTAEFRNYIQDCRIGYNYEDNEIIVSNSSYPYSYVYGGGGWYKISQSVSDFMNSYPGCYAVIKDGSAYGLWDMHNPLRTVNNVLLITKPIKFGTTTHKRVLQVALRGTSRPSESDVYLRGENVHRDGIPVQIFSRCGFYILGANDAEHFVLVSGREKLEDVRDLITKMNKSKAYKYFMIVLAGGVRTDVALNYIEFMVDETYTNRLR